MTVHLRPLQVPLDEGIDAFSDYDNPADDFVN